MGTSGKGTAIVGYNVQTAVDAQHHLIVAHDVTNVGHDRDQLSNMAEFHCPVRVFNLCFQEVPQHKPTLNRQFNTEELPSLKNAAPTLRD
jgi:hypothetical protein